MHYADTSALAKLVVPERESAALRDWLRESSVELAVSSLARTELLRATRRAQTDPDAVGRARDVLARLTLIEMSSEILDGAALLDPIEVRSLDAIHLSTALAIGDELESVLTYDDRMAEAARALGLAVTAPH